MDELLKQIREALAEGCSCCRQEENHTEAAERLGKLLNDGSGYAFLQFNTRGVKL